MNIAKAWASFWWWAIYHGGCSPRRMRREIRVLGYHNCDKREIERDLREYGKHL